MNKNEPPFLAIDYRILALDIKAAINEKTIDSSTIIKLKLVYSYLLGGNDSNLLIVFYVQIMPDDFVMQLHRF